MLFSLLVLASWYVMHLCLLTGMQKDQIVVETFGKTTLGPNREGAFLQSGEPACGLSFGEVAIPPFVILHARLSDERCSVGECPHDIGQMVMRFILEHVANRERRVLWDRQPIGVRKLWADVATRVAFDQGIIFKPQKETFFELATKRLCDER
jgi:hypothetical protein